MSTGWNDGVAAEQKVIAFIVKNGAAADHIFPSSFH
jgi:hypothetical protein